MKLHILGQLLYGIAASAAVVDVGRSAPSRLCDSNHEEPIRNANHMFNAIRGAMRQWDNSWNHNGMSFFVATVPQGVQLYHGTAKSEPIKGLEWLAFEPEHALMFARPRMRPGHRGPGGPGGPPPPHLSEEPDMFRKDHPPPFGGPHHDNPPPPPRVDWNEPHGPTDFEHQRFLGEVHSEHGPPSMQPNGSGYLHFYRTSHDLKLVYIDGTSAGKTSKGTLDSQDYILGLNEYNSSNAPMRESERANALCDIARTTWAGHIDGFIRMESGFEIILCDFEAGLTFERAQKNKNRRSTDSLSPFRLYRAVADRFNGIGGGRAAVDYASFVSAFNWDFEKELFVEDKTFPGQTLPRLKEQKEENLLALRERVVETISRAVKGELEPTIDWQAIAEMFVQRYAAPLRYLSENEFSKKELKRELRSLLRPFTSDRLNDTKVVTDRCVEQFMPSIWSATFAGRVVYEVASELCGTLVKTLHNLEQSKHGGTTFDGKTAISELVSYLDWPVWRECSPACKYDEVCVLPIWPITGDIEDRKAPACKNLTAFNDDTWSPSRGNSSYWWDGGDRHPPPLLGL